MWIRIRGVERCVAYLVERKDRKFLQLLREDALILEHNLSDGFNIGRETVEHDELFTALNFLKLVEEGLDLGLKVVKKLLLLWLTTGLLRSQDVELKLLYQGFNLNGTDVLFGFAHQVVQVEPALDAQQ